MDYLRKRIPMIVKQCEDMSTYGCHVYVSITPSRVFQILKAAFRMANWWAFKEDPQLHVTYLSFQVVKLDFVEFKYQESVRILKTVWGPVLTLLILHARHPIKSQSIWGRMSSNKTANVRTFANEQTFLKSIYAFLKGFSSFRKYKNHVFGEANYKNSVHFL